MANLQLRLELLVQEHGASGALDTAKKQVEGLGQSIKQTAETAAAFWLEGMIVQFGQKLVGTIDESINKTQEFAGQTKALMKIAGGTAEDTGTLLAAFERFGVGVEQAGTSLGIFAKHLLGMHGPLEDFSRGVDEKGKPLKGFAETMRGLGVNFEDARGKFRPMQDVLFDVVDKFKGMENGTEKTALAMRLFGRSGKDMMGVLSQGREGIHEAMEAAAKYGLQLSTKNLADVTAFGLAHKDLDEAMNGLKDPARPGGDPAVRRARHGRRAAGADVQHGHHAGDQGVCRAADPAGQPDPRGHRGGLSVPVRERTAQGSR